MKPLPRQRVTVLFAGETILVRLFENCTRDEVNQFMDGAALTTTALGIWMQDASISKAIAVRWEEC